MERVTNGGFVIQVHAEIEIELQFFFFLICFVDLNRLIDLREC